MTTSGGDIWRWLLRGHDPEERRAIADDAERLLNAARARRRGASAAAWLALMWDLAIGGAGHDLARAVRSLVRAPGWTLTVSLRLGVGVAATTTLFALINAVLLKPLPYDDPNGWSWSGSRTRPRIVCARGPARRAAGVDPVSAMRI